jgi:hypothetical protein
MLTYTTQRLGLNYGRTAIHNHSIRTYSNGVVIDRNLTLKEFNIISNHNINLKNCINWNEVNKIIEGIN